MSNMLGRAIAITAEAFKNKTDKGGNPYILHCLRVMNDIPAHDHELRCIAVMHDLVEDTQWTLEDLRREGFSERVIYGVFMMTHADTVPYDDYIKYIATSPDARLVKLADLKDNSDITRMKGLTRRDLDRLEKYHRSWMYLSKV